MLIIEIAVWAVVLWLGFKVACWLLGKWGESSIKHWASGGKEK